MVARTPAAAALAACLLGTVAFPADASLAPLPRQVVTVANVYVLPEISVYVGDTLTLTNLDVRAHDLVSRNVSGGVRVFASAPTDPRGRSDVAGVSSLPAGVYPFSCSIHESMLGNLRVDAAPAR